MPPRPLIEVAGPDGWARRLESLAGERARAVSLDPPGAVAPLGPDGLRSYAQRLTSGGPAGGLRICLRLDAPLEARLAHVDGPLVGGRLLDTASKVVSSRLAGYRGVVALRWEEAGAADRPVLEAFVFPGEGARAVPAGEARAALEGEWRGAIYRAFDVALPEPGVERQRERVAELETRWREARRELGAALEARMDARLSQAEFRERAIKALEAQYAAVDALRELSPARGRVVLEVLHVRLEGGADLLRPLRETERQAFVEGVVRDVAGVHAPKGTCLMPAGAGRRDLVLLAYFEPGAGRELARAKIEDGLRPALQARAVERGLDADAAAALGVRLSLRGFDKDGREIAPCGAEPRVDRPAPAAQKPLDRPAPAAARNWGDERVHGVQVSLSGGRSLAQMDVHRRNDILQRVVDRAWPGFERAGVRGNFLAHFRGDEVRLQVLVPESQAEAVAVLRRPATQMRARNEVHRALAEEAGRAGGRQIARPSPAQAMTAPLQPERAVAPRISEAPVPPASVRLEEVAGPAGRHHVGVHRVEGGGRYLDVYSSAELDAIVRSALRETYQKEHPFEPARRLDLREASIERSGTDLIVKVPAGTSEAGWYERGQMAGPEAGPLFSRSLADAVAEQERARAREAQLSDRRLALARGEGLDESGTRWTERTLRLGDPQLLQSLSPETRRSVLRDAVSRAFPSLGPAPSVALTIEERQMVAHVAVPDDRLVAGRALASPEAPRLLAESLYRDPRVPVHAAALPTLERAGEVSIRVVLQNLRLADGRHARLLTAIHRIEGGAEYLGRLSPAERQQALRAAIRETHESGLPRRDRAEIADYTFAAAKGRDLEVHVPVGGSQGRGWVERRLIESPVRARRFSDALSRAVADVQGRELLPRGRDTQARARSLQMARVLAGRAVRSLAESPGSTLGHVLKNTLLSRAMPAALQPVARVLARLVPRDE